MSRAEPRVVGHEGIARAHRFLRDDLEKMFDRFGHGVDMTGGASNRLRQHVAVDIENSGGDIAAFTHDRTEGGMHQRLGLLVDDRYQAVPHYLQFDSRCFTGQVYFLPWFCAQ